MSTKLKICDICDDRHITEKATHWCSECEHAFCNECKGNHTFSRLSKHHTTIPIADCLALELGTAATSNICDEHNDIYSLVCETHDQLLCLRCIEKHNDCKDIFSLNEKAKNVKSSRNFEVTKQDLTNIAENIKKIQAELNLHLEMINDEETIQMIEIAAMRKTIDDHLDSLEDRLRKELSKKAIESRTAIEVLLKKLDDKISDVAKIEQYIKDLETHASNFQTYLSVRQLSSAIDSAKCFVQSVAKDGDLEKDTFTLNFDEKIKEIIQNIHQFGIVQVHKKVCQISLIRQKDKQLQLVRFARPLTKSINDIKIKLFKRINTNCTYVRGCEILSDGKMLFNEYTGNGHVVVFDSNGKRLFHILKKQIKPCMDITCINNSSKLAITSGSNECIYIVDINEPEIVQKSITSMNECHGVASSDDSLFCFISNEGIKRIRLDNYKESVLLKLDSNLGYVAVQSNNLYYTDSNKGVVSCSDMNGQPIWTFKDETVLKKPRGISVDIRGCVYVVSSEQNNVVVLSSNGQDKRVLLTEANGLKIPRALHYDKLKNRLLVANEKASAFLFDVSE